MEQELIDLLEEYVKVNTTLKVYETKKTEVTAKIKQYAKDNPNVSFPLQYGSKEFKLSDSTRKTISEKNKPLLMDYLNKQGKSYLLLQSIEVDKDALYTEIQNGMIDKAEVTKYMKVTEIQTLTCSDIK